MENTSGNNFTESDSRGASPAGLPLPALENNGEIVGAFSPASELPDAHRFKAGSQVAVLIMGILAATATVLALAGVEHSLSWAIDTGVLPPPPGPETYTLSIFD